MGCYVVEVPQGEYSIELPVDTKLRRVFQCSSMQLCSYLFNLCSYLFNNRPFFSSKFGVRFSKILWNFFYYALVISGQIRFKSQKKKLPIEAIKKEEVALQSNCQLEKANSLCAIEPM